MLLKQQQAVTLAPTLTPADDYCAACGLDERLTERLVSDQQGRVFESVAISTQTVQSPDDLAGQSALLFRREPVAGFEALLHSNMQHYGDEAALRLHQRLAARTQNAALSRFLADLLQNLQTLREKLAPDAAAIEQEYHSSQTALWSWQDQTQTQPGVLGNLWTWVLGNSQRLSLPQAIWHWNERERLALRLHACKAALTLLGALCDTVSQILEQGASIRDAAIRYQAQVEQHLTSASNHVPSYAPWSWRSNVSIIATQLSHQTVLEEPLTILFAHLADTKQTTNLAAQVQRLAQQESERLLNGLSTIQLIETEAHMEPVEGLDPLVAIGRQLLDQLQQRPGWRLSSSARPRVETVQITPDGEPIYRLDGLATAAYGGTSDRLGFLQVELDVAIEDLALFQSDDEGFRQTLERRNVFVLEELATAWAPTSDAVVARNGDLLEEVPLG